jgi:hypothetical protein
MPSDVSLMAKKFYFFDCLLDGVRFIRSSIRRFFNIKTYVDCIPFR